MECALLNTPGGLALNGHLLKVSCEEVIDIFITKQQERLRLFVISFLCVCLAINNHLAYAWLEVE